jgi:glycosyltransferase involved in cell wall biosynthesis
MTAGASMPGGGDDRKDMPLVSVVIPVYNCESYLAEAIDSVLSQDYPRIELIVLDDGSTDASRSVMERYPESAFIRESHANMGQSATLNKGWAMAKGEILSYLSADDALLSGAVSKAVERLDAHPDVVMVYGDYQLMDADSKTTAHVSAPDFSYREMVRDIVVQPGPGVFFRRECFERLGGWDVTLRQTPDYEYWLRLALLGPFLHIPAEMARFRVHEASQSFHSTTLEKSDEVIRVLERYFGRDDVPADIARLRAQAIAMAYVVAGRFHLRAGRNGIFCKRLASAIGTHPWVAFRPRTVRLLLNALKHRVITG